jgi:RNA polymerase sigma-70 factor (ECF subfamily)
LNPGPRPALRLVPGSAEKRADAEPSDALSVVAPEGSAPGPEVSLEALYERYATYVGALASRILGRASEVEDVVQDVFTSAVRSLRRRNDVRELKSWLATVTVRRCVRQLRFRRMWAVVDLAADPSYDRLPDTGASADERQLIIEVYRALDRLPSRERVPWTLRHVEGESLGRVATLCGCSLATAKRRIAEAQAKISWELRGRHD